MRETDRSYQTQCRNWDAYEQLGREMRQWPEFALMSAQHLEKRGLYAEYPDRAVTHAKDARGRPLFIQCSSCGRQHCTDAWLPFGYSSFNDRAQLGGDGSPARPYLYYCRDLSQCRGPKGGVSVPMRQSVNYSCTYQRCH